jgi:hypothetical protein
MGLYDDRLLELSEKRHGSRAAQRRASPAPRNPMLRSREQAEPKPSMSAQSLLFDRSAGWTDSKAKAWAKSHGYLYGKVDVTDQYVRIRQFDPKGSKVIRTIPFGRGIRAVVAREEESSMRTSTVKAPRHRRAKKSTTAKRRPAKKSARRASPRRKRRKVKAVAVATRKRRRTVRVEAKRSRRRRVARTSVMEAPKRRRRPRKVSAWKGDSAGHRKAAKEGHRRAKARKARKSRSRRKSRKMREVTYAAAPKRRRRSTREPMVMEAKRSKRRYHTRAASKRSGGMGPAEIALMIGMGGVGFVLADGLDRLLATYDPSGKPEDKPKDKFTSDGTGSLANTLNIASRPGLGRFAVSVGLAAAPAAGAYFVKNSYAKGALEGLAVGAGINLFKTLWSNVLMPMLVGKDTTAPALQKSYIARLYPAEVAAHINIAARTKDADGKVAPGPYPASGVLSDAPDVGPFALAAGDSPYPTAAEALRQQAGLHGEYPTAAEALRQQAGLHGEYPTAAEALRAAGVGYQPGPPPGPGPGPQAEPFKEASCGCVGDPTAMFTALLGDSESSMQ